MAPLDPHVEAARTREARADRIAFDWPGKGDIPTQDAQSGNWSTAPADADRFGIPLVTATPSVGSPPWSVVLSGDRLTALGLARKLTRRSAKLAYLDLPRLHGYDESRSFQGPTSRRWSTWLSVVREHVRAARRTLAEDGVVVLQCGDEEAHYARVVALEEFGHENDLGCIVWRTHYSPKGGKSTNEVVRIHEYLLVFAHDREAISSVALPVKPSGYDNPDGDPRGDWEARQKDAGRDTARVEYQLPPYRWELTDGALPPGLWRVSPHSGVIWGVPETPGEYSFTVRVGDSEGTTSESEVTLRILADGDGHFEDDIWWIVDPPDSDDREPRITETELPPGVAGEEYSYVLRAEGGVPHAGEKRPSRGWAFGQATLNAAILEDRCYFGKKGTAIPEPKRYLADLEGGLKYVNVSSVWDGSEVGWTQEATKHLKDLRDAGRISETTTLSKPERLLARLLSIFTEPGDTVVEVFGRSADLAGSAMKLGRRAVLTAGTGEPDEALRDELALPRLRTIVEGADPDLDGEHASDHQGPNGLQHYVVGREDLAVLQRPSEQPHLSPDLPVDDCREPVLIAEGYLVDSAHPQLGMSWDGDEVALVLEPGEFLTLPLLARLADDHPSSRVTIYYFRASDDLDGTDLPERVSLKRVPMDLTP